jgi:hypothetical protein
MIAKTPERAIGAPFMQAAPVVAVEVGVADSVVVVERVRVVTELEEVAVEVRVVELPLVPVVVIVVVDSAGAVVLIVVRDPSLAVVVYW